MTKEGYRQILVSIATHDRLKTVASKNSLSLGKTIDRLLSIDTVSIPQISVNNKTSEQNTVVEPRQDFVSVADDMVGRVGFGPTITWVLAYSWSRAKYLRPCWTIAPEKQTIMNFSAR